MKVIVKHLGKCDGIVKHWKSRNCEASWKITSFNKNMEHVTCMLSYKTVVYCTVICLNNPTLTYNKQTYESVTFATNKRYLEFQTSMFKRKKNCIINFESNFEAQFTRMTFRDNREASPHCTYGGWSWAWASGRRDKRDKPLTATMSRNNEVE